MNLTHIPVFYSPAMVADAESYSPSAMKPAKVLEAWQASGIPLSLYDVKPIERAALHAVHEQTFVDDVLACVQPNGFGSHSPTVAQSLLYTNASLRDAAVEALRNGCVAVSPTSGFHHAHYSSASAYCTFNGLMVAAHYLLQNKLATKVGIIDCDYHYGNGTDELISKHHLSGKVKHFTAGSRYHRANQAEDFFNALKTAVEFMADCDVILYQAGADAHIDDPLGGFLTDEQLYQRDLLLFSLCQQQGVPVAWNLAGGYQKLDNDEPDWEAITAIHSNTLRACGEVYSLI